ncbi:FAD-dependent oxidoreductase [Candidatus Cloacimonas acidaminovorans]|jgi:NAD(P)H-flavin reductase|uniref:Nitric oxide dioxygenase n=1 Tax=Cloacimonas acidaminovorans (strain Evry) TaxID=459349 RepID=B0VEW4_CLOAI|nr:FAD-dependent oxidoreductase [Candidatus Cloacimonas acidaminovorans]CAO80531.1 putative Nitric oxide dioxygenase [Candidatus Cloacimonas acidaminovorans str. Evry]
MSVVVKSPCVVTYLKRITETLTVIELQPLKRLPKYKPGQFLHLTLDYYDPAKNWPESRVFSIANYDPEVKTLRIIYSVKGKYTKLMNDNLQENQQVWVKMPYGDFTFNSITDNMIFIAGGTGITPFLSYLESIKYKIPDKNIWLFYGAKEKNCMVGEELIDNIVLVNPRFKVKKYLEYKSGNERYEMGKLEADKILEELQSIGEADFYISGPPEMIQYFKQSIIDAGIKQEFIHIDAWE